MSLFQTRRQFTRTGNLRRSRWLCSRKIPRTVKPCGKNGVKNTKNARNVIHIMKKGNIYVGLYLNDASGLTGTYHTDAVTLDGRGRDRRFCEERRSSVVLPSFPWPHFPLCMMSWGSQPFLKFLTYLLKIKGITVFSISPWNTQVFDGSLIVARCWFF